MKLRGLAVGAAALGSVVTMGCSDPAAPPAVGGVYIEVTSPSPTIPGKQCPHTGGAGITLGFVPPNVADKGKPLTDDEDGATVKCSVGSGETIKFSGQVQKGANSFRISGTVTKSTMTGTASVAFYDPAAVTTFTTPTDTLCDVVATPDPMKIGDDTAWGRISCPSLVSPSQPNAACMAPVGYFYFGECD